MLSRLKKLASKVKSVLRGKGHGGNSVAWPPGDKARYLELFGAESVDRRRFYNVGAGGNFRHPAWTSVGMESGKYAHPNVDLAWNLLDLTPMPLKSRTAEIIYTSYTLEHVTDQAVQNFLDEAHRVLRTGGILRVIVPDIEIYYAAYQAKDATPFYKPKHDRMEFPTEKLNSNPNQASFEQRFLWTFATATSELHTSPGVERISDAELRQVLAEMPLEQALDYCTSRCSIEFQRAHPEYHINWFHAAKLTRMLRAAGFTEPYRSAMGQSRSPVLRDLALFDSRRPEIGLYMEAVK